MPKKILSPPEKYARLVRELVFRIACEDSDIVVESKEEKNERRKKLEEILSKGIQRYCEPLD